MLKEKNSTQKFEIASMVKLMTTLLVMESIENDKFSLDDLVTISDYAASQEGSEAFLEPNKNYSIDELLKSVIIASANDSSVALAANDVVSMLQSYQNYESSHVQESSASLFFLQQEQDKSECISFYLIDAGKLSLEGSSFKLSFSSTFSNSTKTFEWQTFVTIAFTISPISTSVVLEIL